MDTTSAGRALNSLFPLLRLALWGEPLRSEELSDILAFREEDWDELLLLSREQTVTGLLYRGVELLPEEVVVPDAIVLRMISEADLIRRRNRTVAGVSRRVTGFLESRGCHPVILKGSVCAARYLQPELREAGDIDIYLSPSEFDGAVASLAEKEIALSEAPDRSRHFEIDGVDIDLHRRYFDLHVKTSILPNVPSPEAELLMLSSHILKHACGTGVGLRQCCDFATALRDSSVSADAMERLYRQCGIWRWNRLLHSFLEEYLHLPSPYPRSDSAPLVKVISRGGNFGHHAPSRRDELRGSVIRRKTGTALRILRNIPFSIRYAPRETIPLLLELASGNHRPHYFSLRKRASLSL